MTFGELLAQVRREIIVDEYEDAFTDSDIRDVLWRSAVDTAGAFGIPRAIATAAVLTDAGTIAAPANCAQVLSLSIAGYDAQSAELQQVIRMRAPGPGPVKYFNFDPRREPGSSINIAPVVSVAGTVTIEYVAAMTRPDSGDFDDTEAWLGTLPRFHPLIAYRAGVTLFQMDERENETEFWNQEYQKRAAELAAFLGRTDMANLMIEPGRRDDEGARG